MNVHVNKTMFGSLIARLCHPYSPVPVEALSDNYPQLLQRLDKASINTAKTACCFFLDKARIYAKYDPEKRNLFYKLSAVYDNLSRQQKISTGQGFITDFVTVAKQVLPSENSRHFQSQSQLFDFLSELSSFDFPTTLNPESTCG
jgi:homoserine trans-succinylase